VSLELVDPPDGSLSRELYLTVGQEWWWTDRQDWSIEQWQRRADAVQTWIGLAAGERAGYGELVPHPNGDVELTCFGLLRGFRGRHIGGHLLTLIVAKAWDIPGCRRLRLSTGTRDSSVALPNYLARGFTVLETREEPDPAPPKFLAAS
jgi:ribosomal protein S18 acetylase RimI-like enzyme